MLVTVLLAAALWPITMWALQDPLFWFFTTDRRVTAWILASMFGSMMAAIWSVDIGPAKWSKAELPLFGFQAMGTRLLMAVATTLVLNIFTTRLINHLGVHTSYLIVLLHQGLSAVGVVWVTLFIADALTRHYGAKRSSST